jgi:hypothetical protein
MRALLRHAFAFVAASLIVAGCSHATRVEPGAPPVGAHLTTAEAVRIAQQAAEREGRRLSDYKLPEPHYQYTRKDKSWWVSFDGQVPAPGNHFSVLIDDQTGKTQLMPGR